MLYIADKRERSAFNIRKFEIETVQISRMLFFKLADFFLLKKIMILLMQLFQKFMEITTNIWAQKFQPFYVYGIQTDKQTDKQSLYILEAEFTSLVQKMFKE